MNHEYPHRFARRKIRERRNNLKALMFVLALGGGVVGFVYMTQDPKPPIHEEVVAAASTEVENPRRYDLSSITLPDTGQAAVAVLGDAPPRHTESERPAPIASVTKVITSLAALKKAPITPGSTGDTITLNAQDEQYYWDYAAKLGTLTPVTAGYDMSQYEVLQAILLASANNMADTLVDRYFSSHEEYVNFANDMLKNDFGLEHTHVADTTGFSPESVSTPSDMIVIAQHVLANPTIAEIVAQPRAAIAVAGEIPNYNLLINEPNVTGIKPGLTDESGYCLLFSANLQNKDGELVTFVGIVMGVQDRPTYHNAVHSILDEARLTIAQQ